MFNVHTSSLTTNYSPRMMFETLGYHSALYDEFFYPMNPCLYYSRMARNTMMAKLQYSLTERENLSLDLCSCNIRRSRQVAIGMHITTPRELERKLFCIRAENNRMEVHCNRYNLGHIARDRAA